MRRFIGQIKELDLKQTEFHGYSPAELAHMDLEAVKISGWIDTELRYRFQSY